MSWPLARYKTFAAAGSHTAADSNGMQDQLLNATGLHLDGFTNISTVEARTNVAFGLMTTPDRVSGVVVPTSGLIFVEVMMTWQQSNANAAAAAIFIGANQLKNEFDGSLVVNQATIGGNIAADALLVSAGGAGLDGSQAFGAYAGDATTGQIISRQANGARSGLIPIFVPAGTYDISVQFKASAGSVTAKNRKLWVYTTT